MSDDWLWMTAADLGRAIEAGSADPRELTEDYLSAIDSHPQAAGIYARTTFERARAEADAASVRARAGLRCGPLDGVPISWKDLFDTAGTATEAGSALLHGRIPTRDAAVLERATRAGLVCLGKTHMTELAFSGLGLNPVTATPPNINDPELVPGGSSSGAATSVAFGLAAAGIGSDTGGSVRVPAAWNDLVGLKTSPRLLPLDGVVPLCPRFDTIGPLCRSVEDAGLLFAVLSGARPADLKGARLAERRFLVCEASGLAPVGGPPQDAFEQALDALASEGAIIERERLDCVDVALDLASCVFAAEAYGIWRNEIEAQPEVMFTPVRERFQSGGAYSAADYVRAWRTLDAQRAVYTHETAAYDAVLLPTAPNMPPNVERLLEDDAYFTTENLLTLRNTRVANLMGLCALTLPTGVPSCGIMAMSAPGSEARLLRLGRAMERVLA